VAFVLAVLAMKTIVPLELVVLVSGSFGCNWRAAVPELSSSSTAPPAPLPQLPFSVPLIASRRKTVQDKGPQRDIPPISHFHDRVKEGQVQEND